MKPWLRFPLIYLAFDIPLRAAMACGLPAWREWPPVDAHDIGFLCALVVWAITQRRPGQGDVRSPNPERTDHGH